MMKKILFLLFVVMGVTVTFSHAQLKTGDSGLDASLKVIGKDADLDWLNFKKESSESYQVPEEKIETMSKKDGMNAGDIYMALEVSKQSKRSIDDVITSYKANKSKGWGAISKDLGIKPGSPEFHALKNSADEKAKKGKSAQTAPKDKSKAKQEKAKKKKT